LDTRRKYLFSWQELLRKIHSTLKIYSTPPYLMYVSYIYFTCLLRLIWQKKFIQNMKDFVKESWRFQILATPEIQVPIWLIDAYWSGNKKIQLNSKIFKINGKTSKRLSWKGFDWWFFFSWFFKKNIGGEK
jgi:hypothetical protein